MDIKILKSITTRAEYSRRQHLIIGTHNGVFHSDEVVAIATLCLLYEKMRIRIVRTRDESVLSECDISVDIGGGSYDHHQPGFILVKENNVPYASAGLVWRDFGLNLILKYRSEIFPEYHGFDEEISKKFDDDVISLVDCEDNGIEADKHCFSFISSFLPLWNDSNPNFDEQFLNVLKVTMQVLEQEIIKTINCFITKGILKNYWKKSEYFSNNILEIPSQTMPWKEAIVRINKSILLPFRNEDSINFVIFPYPAGGWAAQCVPKSLKKKFSQRIPFPKEWAGQTERLPQISTVNDAIFCHNECFFARAKTKDGVIKMCELAMKANK